MLDEDLDLARVHPHVDVADLPGRFDPKQLRVQFAVAHRGRSCLARPRRCQTSSTQLQPSLRGHLGRQAPTRNPEAPVDGFLDEPTCLMRSGWSIGLSAEGDFELKGVASNDLLDVLGFENGDEFASITAGGDRFMVDTGIGALAALNALQGETEFDVDIVRDGSTVTQSYRIVP